jgi:hypothetical protein
VGSPVAMPGHVGGDLLSDGVTDRAAVVPEAAADAGVELQAGMRQPEGAEPVLRLGPAPGELVGTDEVRVGEFRQLEELRPLLPADHREALTIVWNICGAEQLERL